jgi:hypothetical protein
VPIVSSPSRLPGWHDQATTDPGRVRATLAAGNAGVACRASRVVGLDLDGAAGIAAFEDASAAHGQPWPDTLTVSTPHGGRHLYWRVPAGLVVFSYSAPASTCARPAGEYVLTQDAPMMTLPA